MNAPATDRSGWGCATGLAVLLAGTIVSGLATHNMAMSQTWLKAGIRVSVSAAGEAVFYALGCLAGLACVAVMYGMVCLVLDGRGTLPQWRRGWRVVVLVLSAAIVGLIAAMGAVYVLNFVVSTMPDELLDVLTDEIPAPEDSYSIFTKRRTGLS